MTRASNDDRSPYRRVATLAVVLAMVGVPMTWATVGQPAGGNAAGPGAGNASTAGYVAVQGDQCTSVASFAGNESPKAFYDYRAPFPDNPYVNATGTTFSSEGTVDLQRPSTSIVFLYTDTNGTETEADDTVSLVFVHGNLGNSASDSGAASFDITGLPENGSWTVRDDDFDGPDSTDVWDVTGNEASVDWSWASAVTDGGVYTGLETDAGATVTVSPGFNEEAAQFGQFYDGTVENWQVLSNDTVNGTATVNRTNLSLTDPLVITTEGCEAAPSDGTPTPTPTATPTETATEAPAATETETPTETPEATETETAG